MVRRGAWVALRTVAALGGGMTATFIEIGVLLAIIAFLGFLAYDDHKNRRRREEEDRLKEQQAQKRDDDEERP